jgi:TolB-like protein/cytochrome c-type biogenesis protein CcmH/NrfG
VVALLAASPVVVWYFVHRAHTAEAPAVTADTTTGPSIAVLPLVNLSSDKEQEYFSDGLSEELLNLLAKVPNLHVAARTSTFAFKGKNEDVSAIAQKLHVATVLEGSVRKSGDQIRITTQLINASDGFHLWSETYDRKLTDVFAVQDEIASAVVAALKMRLLRAPTSQERRTVPEAYTQYLLGRQYFHRNNVDGFRRSMVAYEKAVALDPNYAPAWAGLSLAAFWIADNGPTVEEVAKGQERALAAAETAIRMGPEMPDGYLSRAFARIPIHWEWEGARADLQKALSLTPEDPDVLHTYAQVVLRPMGQLPEAIAVMRKAAERDPMNARMWSALGAMFFLDGQSVPARDALYRSLEISPDQSFTSFYLGTTFLLDGQPAAAKPIYARSTNEVFTLAGAALAEYDLGNAAGSKRALDDLLTRFADTAAFQIAEVYAWRGEKDQAFEWLERARVQRDGGLVNVKVDPLLRKLRGDPRRAAILRRLNLPVDP